MNTEKLIHMPQCSTIVLSALCNSSNSIWKTIENHRWVKLSCENIGMCLSYVPFTLVIRLISCWDFIQIWYDNKMLSSQWDNDNQHFVHSIVSWYLLGIITRQGFLFSCSCMNSFVYTSGQCRRWRSRMGVKIMAGSLFVHCKIVYFYSVTAEKWLIVSLPNFVTIRRTHFSISCKIFSWIRSTKLKTHAIEFCDFIKDSVSPSGLFVPCSLTVTSTWRPRLTAHCPIGERH